MAVAGSDLARSPCPLNVILQCEKEEASAVCWHFDTRPRIFAAQVQSVVVRADYIVVGGELRVGAEVNRVLLCWQRLF